MTTVAMISAAKRKSLPGGKFALPSLRKYPIDTAARVRNAAARLEQQKGSMPESQYKQARAAIARAAKKFGIDSEYNKRTGAEPSADDVHQPGPMKTVRRPGLHMRIGTDGSIEVRHNADSGSFLCGESIALAETANDNAAPVWIQVAKCGQFAGHPAGPFRLGEKEFGEIVANFKSTQNKRVPIDFEHASEADATEGSIPTEGAPAQGWIVDLDNRGAQGLWALVQWGDKAREYIRAGQYRYISPAVRFNSKDRVTGQPIGARLTSAGLTNQPFLDGMQPLAAKDGGLSCPMMPMGDFMRGCRAALNLSELSTHAECKDQLDRLRDMCGMADDPMGIHEGVDLGGYVTRCNALMNMPAHATIEQLFDAVEEMIDAAMARHEAEYHEDEGPGSEPGEAMSAMADRTEDTAMADVNLKDIEQKIAAQIEQQFAAKMRDIEEREAKLSLQLKDAESKVAEKAKEVEAKDAEIAKMRDEQVKRAEADAQARVDEAFTAYKDVKKLTDLDKTSMAIVLKADPATFDKLYPRIAPNQQHLLRNLTGQQINGGQHVQMSGKRPDVPGHVVPPMPQASAASVQRGAALKALASGASPEQAILASLKASRAAQA